MYAIRSYYDQDCDGSDLVCPDECVPAEEICGDGIDQDCVITSYSIHYTKLYDGLGIPEHLARYRPGVRILTVTILPEDSFPDVITSYSIHYTKLYETKS